MEKKNDDRRRILMKSLEAAFGLFCFGFGVYLTIRANIGVAPWDAFTIGLSNQLGVLYGTASIGISFLLIIIDYLLKEHIGIGTILDAIVVGKTVDLFQWLDIIPLQQSLWSGILIMLLGHFVMGYSMYFYMKAGLCCGPRDSLMIALGRRFNKIPIGLVNAMILVVVLFAGWRLGGPIGIGTVLGAFDVAFMMQLAFYFAKFEPKDVEHQSIVESAKVLFQKQNK